MTRAVGANLQAARAGRTTRTFFLTEGLRLLTAGSSDVLSLAFGPAPDYGCGRRRSSRRSLARATVRICQGDKISMSTSSSDGGSSAAVGRQTTVAAPPPTVAAPPWTVPSDAVAPVGPCRSACSSTWTSAFGSPSSHVSVSHRQYS